MNRTDRFWLNVEKTETCWLWKQKPSAEGYGRFQTKPDPHTYAHRFAYELLVGPIPEGLHLDHLCRVRICVNPQHLEPVTCRENVIRGIGPAAIHHAQTHCIHGHEFTQANTYYRRDRKYPARICRRCRADRENVRHQQRALAVAS